MAAAVETHDMAANLLAAAGRNELAIRWADPATGTLCKAKFDRLLDSEVIVDIKTAADPSPEAWAKSAANYGYHRQAGWYQDAATLVFGGQWVTLHIVVGSEAPHEVVVYELNADALAFGHWQNYQDVLRLSKCRKSNHWQHAWQEGIARIALPRWAMTEER
jgi:hypothetical protein